MAFVEKKWPAIDIETDKNICKNCRKCLSICPSKCLVEDSGKIGMKLVDCINCEMCGPVCPESYIVFSKLKDESYGFTPNDQITWLSTK